MYDKMMDVAQIDELSTPLDSRHHYSAMGGPILWIYGQGIIFWSILELVFCSVRECQFFVDGGQLHILLDHEHVARVPTWKMPKNTCMTYQKPIFMHNFHSMPQVGIQ